MDNLRSLIPRNKHDLENVKRLKEFDPADLKPIIPELLIWIQDINRPVAVEIAKFLVSYGREIVPELKKVMESSDDDWKFACIGWVIKGLPRETVEELETELKQIAFQPNLTERNSELADSAKEIYVLLSCKAKAASRTTGSLCL